MNTPVVTAFQTGTHRTENSLGLGLLRQPGTVLFGPGQRRQLPRLVSSIGQRVLMITDSRMADSPEFAVITEGLTACGVAVEVYGGTEPDLPRRNVTEITGDRKSVV